MLADDLCLALDPVEFARSLQFDPDPWQQKALQWRRGHGLLLNCSRQSGKSTIAALLAVHQALYKPKSLTLCVSASLRQSGELFRKVGDWFDRLAVKPHFEEDNKLSCVLDNGSRIVSLPSSEATIRGFSAVNLLIFDEASRVDDPLYYSVRPMLAVSRGSVIAMSTPFGKRGWWYEAWANGGDEWERIEVKATDIPRIMPEFLASELRNLGEWWFNQEYLCSFEESINAVFSLDLLEAAERDDLVPLWE
jgi:terminase large subunit-like protein